MFVLYQTFIALTYDEKRLFLKKIYPLSYKNLFQSLVVCRKSHTFAAQLGEWGISSLG